MPWWLSGVKGAASWVPPAEQVLQPSGPQASMEVERSQNSGMSVAHHVRPIHERVDIQECVSPALLATEVGQSPQSFACKSASEGADCWKVGEGIKLPPTPISPGQGIGQLAAGDGPLKVPISLQVTPLTPPPENPTRTSPLPPAYAMDDMVWRRPTPPRPSPPPFDDMYFSPLDYHRGSRVPGDHLLANFHSVPIVDKPW